MITKIKEKLFLLNPKYRKAIQERQKICEECPFNSYNAVKSGIYETNRTDLHCKFCGCVIALYTRCLTCNCGIEKYNEEHNLNLPLKWHKLI